MRTRTSWRNQDRLFKELFQPPAQPKPDPQPIKTDEEIDAMFWMSKTSRNQLKREAQKQRKSNAHNA